LERSKGGGKISAKNDDFVTTARSNPRMPLFFPNFDHRPMLPGLSEGV
jgi:hypothetical protein